MQRTAATLPVDRRYVIAAAALALPTVALSLLAATYDTFPLDAAIMARVQALGPDFEPVARLFNEYNGYIAITAVVLGTALMLVRRRPDAALLFLLAAAVRPSLNELKTLVDRPRASGDFPILDVVYDSSFPSGHVMTAVFLGLWFILAAEMLPRSLVLPARAFTAALILEARRAISRAPASSPGPRCPSPLRGARLSELTRGPPEDQHQRQPDGRHLERNPQPPPGPPGASCGCHIVSLSPHALRHATSHLGPRHPPAIRVPRCIRNAPSSLDDLTASMQKGRRGPAQSLRRSSLSRPTAHRQIQRSPIVFPSEFGESAALRRAARSDSALRPNRPTMNMKINDSASPIPATAIAAIIDSLTRVTLRLLTNPARKPRCAVHAPAGG